MKILVVDDSGVQRKMITQIIRKAGFENEVVEAGDGQEAIQKLGTQYKEIGLILCDWNMPKMSGIEFVEGVAKVPAVARIPLFMVTSEGTQDRMQEAFSKHPMMAGYITKPFTPEQLKEKISKFLQE